MKKIILLAAFAASTSICSAQVSFGLQVGPNFGMGKFKYNEASFSGTTTHSQKNKVKVGFLAGVVVEIPIGSQLAFRPELNFIQEGTKHNFSLTAPFYSYAGEQNITLNYIQLPLNVIYKLPVGSGTVFFGLGPSLQFGISGKNKFTSPTDPTDNKNYSVKFDGKKSDGVTDPAYYDKAHLKSFDAGANILAGYKLDMGVFVKLAYTYGFLELDPNNSNVDPSDRSSYKNSGFNISFGYMIGGSKSGKKK